MNRGVSYGSRMFHSGPDMAAGDESVKLVRGQLEDAGIEIFRSSGETFEP